MRVLDDVLNEVEQVECDASERFKQLVRDIFAGDKPATAVVIDVLRAADKDARDLQSAVRLLERRRELREQINQIDRDRERMLELNSLLDDEKSVLEKHAAEHRERCRPLYAELDEIQRRQMSSGNPQQELLTSCPDPELRRRMDSLLTARHNASEKLSKARGNLRRAQAAIGNHDYLRFPDERKKIDRWVERAKKELEAIETEISQLAQQTDELEQQMRDW